MKEACHGQGASGLPEKGDFMRLSWTIVFLTSTLLAGPCLAGVLASSHLKVSDRPEGTYASGNLVDGKLETPWIEGAEESGVGETFTLDLPRAEVKKVMIFPGHGQDQRMFEKYSRLKEVSLSFFTVDDKRNPKPLKQQNFTFEDSFRFQEIPVTDVKLGDELFGGTVTVTIRSVYPGKDFKDTAVAEVRVVLDEWPAQLDASETSPTLTGSAKENLVDADLKTAWVADSSAKEPFVVLSAPEFGICAVVLTAGDAKDLKKANTYSRPKDIVIEIDNITVNYTLKDTLEPQRIDLPSRFGYTGSLFTPLKITVKSVYPGTKASNLSISEISLLATQYAL